MPHSSPQPRTRPKTAPLNRRRIYIVLAAIPVTLVLVVGAALVASRVFGFEIEWVNISVAWVMMVVPSTLFVLATITMRITGKSGPGSGR